MTPFVKQPSLSRFSRGTGSHRAFSCVFCPAAPLLSCLLGARFNSRNPPTRDPIPRDDHSFLTFNLLANRSSHCRARSLFALSLHFLPSCTFPLSLHSNRSFLACYVTKYQGEKSSRSLGERNFSWASWGGGEGRGGRQVDNPYARPSSGVDRQEESRLDEVCRLYKKRSPR